MALSDWTTVTAAGAAFSLQSNSIANIPIEGLKSLRLRMDDTGSGSGGAATHGVAGLTSGANLTTGRIRSLVSLNNFIGNVAWGSLFVMMQNSVSASSSAYWVTFRGTGSDVFLFKGAATGLFSGTALRSAAHGLSLALDTTFAVDLQFQRDTDSGFVILNIAVGTAADFSNLTTKITHTDADAPLSSGVSMGVGGRINTGNIAVRNVFYDRTELFRV